jgi:hypothetical protein
MGHIGPTSSSLHLDNASPPSLRRAVSASFIVPDPMQGTTCTDGAPVRGSSREHALTLLHLREDPA